MIRPLFLAACTLTVAVPAAAQPAPRSTTLQPFRDAAEIAAFYRGLADERQRRVANLPPPSATELMNSAHMYRPPPPNPEPPGTPRQQERPVGQEWMVAAAHQAGGDPRETMATVGEHLVVLRRGRLFAFRAGGDALQLASSVDAGAFPAGLTRYDELLAWGEHVVVIGSSMQRNGTELGVFHVAADGRLTHRATYSLTSGDDIPWHTYAARVVDGRLVLYAPFAVSWRGEAFPALHRWTAESDSTTHVPPETRVYRPAGRIDAADELALHTVATCDLRGDAEMRCAFTGLIAPKTRALHVSATSAYVWTAPVDSAQGGFVLYRMPLDGSAPTALRVLGTPQDPSAVLESADGHLNVLVQTNAALAYEAGGAQARTWLALLRVPLSELGDGRRAAAPGRYRPLPMTSRELTSGYVGEWLIYGPASRLMDRTTSATAVAVRWADGGGLSRIALPHAVERVEALGTGALVIGGDGESLYLNTLRLGPDTATLVDRHVVERTRSLAGHDVFYRADGQDTGVLGVPVRGPERPRDAPWLYGAGGIRFLRHRGLRLEEMGDLSAGEFGGDDGCIRGCRNWFGDTRPLFWRGRILALLGYDVVEAREDAGRIREVRRAGFAPALPTADLSGEWTFDEDIGNRGSRYFCRNQGTMRFDRAGDSLTVRYRQTGECNIEGATTRSDGEGSATGTVWPNAIGFQSGPCRYQGHMNTLNSLDGRMECRIAMPDGTTLPVNGYWRARRPSP
jgi:hypothetical protein